jgi:hypothetical protein
MQIDERLNDFNLRLGARPDRFVGARAGGRFNREFA